MKPNHQLSFAPLRVIIVAVGVAGLVTNLRLAMGIGAGIILWVSGVHFLEFCRAKRFRCLFAAIVGLPAAFWLVWLALTEL